MTVPVIRWSRQENKKHRIGITGTVTRHDTAARPCVAVAWWTVAWLNDPSQDEEQPPKTIRSLTTELK